MPDQHALTTAEITELVDLQRLARLALDAATADLQDGKDDRQAAYKIEYDTALKTLRENFDVTSMLGTFEQEIARRTGRVPLTVTCTVRGATPQHYRVGDVLTFDAIVLDQFLDAMPDETVLWKSLPGNGAQFVPAADTRSAQVTLTAGGDVSIIVEARNQEKGGPLLTVEPAQVVGQVV